MRIVVFTAFAILLLMGTANAKVQSRTVEYEQGGTPLEGYLAWDDAQTAPRPGVLVVHEWYGLNDYAKKRADMLAELGYVAFAADIYGKGVRPSNPQEAGAESGKFAADRPLVRARVKAGLEQLLQAPGVDATRIAAIGYCFGGMCVLELARSGADIAGVVSFHGSLGTPTPAGPGDIKAKVLICHGGADPHVGWDAVQTLTKELDNAKADWQLKVYGGAMHSFTNPNSNLPDMGILYNADADRRSWQDMQDFFHEIFGEKKDQPLTASL